MKFSIFVPTYNRHEILRHTLKSIHEQMHDDYEVFVVDRGSEPSVGADVESLGDPRFHFIQSSQNRHICDDAEQMISSMTGEQFLFLADDDVLLPNALAVVNNLAHTFPDVEYISSGYGIYDFSGCSLEWPRNFSGQVFTYPALFSCYHYLCSWGIGLKKDYYAPPVSHSSLIFLGKGLIDRTRALQKELFIKSYGDIGYVGVLANTKRALYADIPLGIIGAGHPRETDGILDRFKHEAELDYLEHVPNKTVACFENIGLDTHLKVLIRNGLKMDYPPYLRPSAHRRQMKIIVKDHPFTARTWTDLFCVFKSWMWSVLSYLPVRIRHYKKVGSGPVVETTVRFAPVERMDPLGYNTISEAAEHLVSRVKEMRRE